MNSFLQELVDELSNESNTNTSEQYLELLDYAIESDCNSIIQTLGFMTAIQSNFHNHFSTGDESFENYRSYEHSTQMILNTTGIAVPLEILVPSFESSTTDTTGDKKDGMLARAWAWVKRMFTNLWNWISRKKSETHAKVKKDMDEIEESVKELQALIPKIGADVTISVSAHTTMITNNTSLDIYKALADLYNHSKDVNTIAKDHKLTPDNVKTITTKLKSITDGDMGVFESKAPNYIKFIEAIPVKDLRKYSIALIKLLEDLAKDLKSKESQLDANKTPNKEFLEDAKNSIAYTQAMKANTTAQIAQFKRVNILLSLLVKSAKQELSKQEKK